MLLALLMLAGMGGSAFADDVKAPDYTTGTPWLCIGLEGNVTEDTPTDPKENFGLYANKDAQFDEFLDFYGITEGDAMYLAPADRVSIW